MYFHYPADHAKASESVAVKFAFDIPATPIAVRYGYHDISCVTRRILNEKDQLRNWFEFQKPGCICKECRRDRQPILVVAELPSSRVETFDFARFQIDFDDEVDMRLVRRQRYEMTQGVADDQKQRGESSPVWTLTFERNWDAFWARNPNCEEVNMRDGFGFCALDYAAYDNEYEQVLRLLTAGARVMWQRDTMHRSPLTWALKGSNSQLILTLYFAAMNECTDDEKEALYQFESDPTPPEILAHFEELDSVETGI